ncbi:S1 RNA-binding domain-containing protein [Geosporobacter ferrireducens]|uniref:RNA-binding protein n=1 Tax=Geosporobacter ferrireducens TaxID=1424294 RepID=A0A1D8GFN0_9FIRM|nr:S1-like domain-containing RNA-binding protein [Geosporobacter ferrireducens]AOT69695.1 RNA-binding protein [Geosporobacter ferrireducens]MTI54598.1 S1 RNA-binding domain-containing protein [Geosporobacter ferrireducens]
MIEVGKYNVLKVAGITAIGAYLDAETGNPKDNILLPNNQLTEDIKEGDTLEVFIYRDSKDRLIATRKRPLAQVGELAMLKVVQTTQIGAFMDWGLEKDVFLPFQEQKHKVQVGRSYLVKLYIDKSGRICATTDIDKDLSTDSPFKKGDWVNGTVYSIVKDIGAFIAVENKYKGMIPQKEYFEDLRNGDQVNVRIKEIREDGKLDLSLRKAAYKQMEGDSEKVYEALLKKGGFLPLHDKSEPGQIKYHLNMSKAAFKRAVGKLLKENKIVITETGIQQKEE